MAAIKGEIRAPETEFNADLRAPETEFNADLRAPETEFNPDLRAGSQIYRENKYKFAEKLVLGALSPFNARFNKAIKITIENC